MSINWIAYKLSSSSQIDVRLFGAKHPQYEGCRYSRDGRRDAVAPTGCKLHLFERRYICYQLIARRYSQINEDSMKGTVFG